MEQFTKMSEDIEQLKRIVRIVKKQEMTQKEKKGKLNRSKRHEEIFGDNIPLIEIEID